MTHPEPRRIRRGTLLLVLLALLLGAGLRFYRLDAQSFWNDEGNSARLVERSLRLIVGGAGGDIHPPGYYLLLHAWWRVAGGTEFALRALSALCGVLTIALTAALARRAAGSVAAPAAAFIVAVHPLSVYYAQEARMYALLGLVSALTLWAGDRFLRACTRFLRACTPVTRRRQTGAGLLLACAVTLGLYTHYAYAFVLLGTNLAFAALWLTRHRRAWRLLALWIAAHLAAALLFTPWLPYTLKVASWSPPDLNTDPALLQLVRTLLVGITLPATTGLYLPLVAAFLLLPALLSGARSRFVAWASWATALLPLGLIAALGVYRPAYLKFLMLSITPFAVVLTLPLASPRSVRRLPYLALLLLLLLPLQVISLRHLYFDPAYTRTDYRGIVARLEEESGPQDAVVLSAPNQWEVFTYYYAGPLTLYPAPYHPTRERAATWMQELLEAGHPRIYALYWGDQESDPEGRLELQLAQRAYKAQESWVGDVRLAVYGTGPLPEEPEERLDVNLGESVQLRGYSLPGGPLTAGEILPVALFWEADARPADRYKVFLHLLDAEGRLVAQTDAEPVGGFRPTNTWETGEALTDRYGLLLPADLPSGSYTLTAGMYDFGGRRLPITSAGGEPLGDSLALTQVRAGD